MKQNFVKLKIEQKDKEKKTFIINSKGDYHKAVEEIFNNDNLIYNTDINLQFNTSIISIPNPSFIELE